MKQRIIHIAPSLLAADFSQLDNEVKRVALLGATYLHYDVMDGHFVPNISFGVPIVASLSKTHSLINDVHLMIDHPEKFIDAFVKAGAQVVTFHYESFSNDDQRLQLIHKIKKTGIKVGMSIKPLTEVDCLIPFLKELDLVLVMSVEPGFGGQLFLKNALDKIAFLRQFIDRFKLPCLIEVDGGINDLTGPLCIQAGVDILVAGSYLFGHDDLSNRYAKLLRHG
jgi:ribulose-phosphate 3-epimerase